ADLAGRDLTMYFDFDTREANEVLFKLALSPVSQQNALANLNHEIPHWDFVSVKAAGQEWWNKELYRIDIETISEDDKVNFYTSMYHKFLGSTVYMDTNREYRELDQETHVAN